MMQQCTSFFETLERDDDIVTRHSTTEQSGMFTCLHTSKNTNQIILVNILNVAFCCHQQGVHTQCMRGKEQSDGDDEDEVEFLRNSIRCLSLLLVHNAKSIAVSWALRQFLCAFCDKLRYLETDGRHHKSFQISQILGKVNM